MGWQINFGADKSVDLDDLAPEVFQQIADDEDGASWFDVYVSPGARVDRLFLLICAAADHGGVEKPEKPPTIRDEIKLIEMLERTEEIADKPFVDGFPQMPDALETGSSSGVPGDSTGLPTSSDDKESATS